MSFNVNFALHGKKVDGKIKMNLTENPLVWENQTTVIKRNGKEIMCLWSELEIGDVFPDDSVCTDIGNWYHAPCYVVKRFDGLELIATEKHLIHAQAFDTNGSCVNYLFEKSKICMEKFGETQVPCLCVCDIKEALDMNFMVEVGGKRHCQILLVKPFMDGKSVKARCVKTNVDYYDLNGFVSHSCSLPETVKYGLSANTKVRIRRPFSP